MWGWVSISVIGIWSGPFVRKDWPSWMKSNNNVACDMSTATAPWSTVRSIWTNDRGDEQLAVRAPQATSPHTANMRPTAFIQQIKRTPAFRVPQKIPAGRPKNKISFQNGNLRGKNPPPARFPWRGGATLSYMRGDAARAADRPVRSGRTDRHRRHGRGLGGARRGSAGVRQAAGPEVHAGVVRRRSG